MGRGHNDRSGRATHNNNERTEPDGHPNTEPNEQTAHHIRTVAPHGTANTAFDRSFLHLSPPIIAGRDCLIRTHTLQPETCYPNGHGNTGATRATHPNRINSPHHTTRAGQRTAVRALDSPHRSLSLSQREQGHCIRGGDGSSIRTSEWR